MTSFCTIRTTVHVHGITHSNNMDCCLTGIAIKSFFKFKLTMPLFLQNIMKMLLSHNNYWEKWTHYIQCTLDVTPSLGLNENWRLIKRGVTSREHLSVKSQISEFMTTQWHTANVILLHVSVIGLGFHVDTNRTMYLILN